MSRSIPPPAAARDETMAQSGDTYSSVGALHAVGLVDGHFVVEIVERHEHRRATIEELKSHFARGTSNDYPAHWFEAQLVHYGLEPSKSRAVARTRLHDALNSGTLAVPANMAEMETRFKADWFTKSGALESVSPVSAVSKPEPEPAPVLQTRRLIGVKRTAEDDVDAEFAVRSKKSKPSSPRSTPDGNSSSVDTKIFVRRKTTRSPFALELERCFDDRESSSSSDSSDSEDVDSFDGELAPLSDPFRVNGRYNIRCPNAAENYPHSGGGASGYNLVFAVAGPSMWAKFRIGPVDGVMYFPEKPEVASYNQIPFSWRGRESEGPIMRNDDANKGWIEFLGAGRVRGQLDHKSITFNGQRCLAPPDLTPIDAFTMEKLWNKYSETASSDREPLLPFWS